MNKVIRYAAVFSIAVIIASALYLISFALIQKSKGNEVRAYHRLYKIENGEKKFNYLGIVSPVQVEGVKLVDTTLWYDFSVPYPIAPKFKVIAPSDNIEALIAKQLADMLADSIEKMKYNLILDYDRQALAVREAQGIEAPKLPKPSLELSAYGTASPEAGKNGFMASIQPGVLEPENANVAQARVERTVPLVLDNLKMRGYDSVTVKSVTSAEEQFSETDMVDSTTAVAMLPKMRYVRIFGPVTLKQAQITPAMAPIAFPIELLSVLGLLSLFLLLWNRKKTVAPVVEEEEMQQLQVIHTPYIPSKRPHRYDFLLVLLIAIVIAIIALIVHFWKFFLGLLLLFVVYQILNAAYAFVKKSVGPVVYWFMKQRAYWATKPTACKVVVTALALYVILTLVLVVTYLLGMWHICF